MGFFNLFRPDKDAIFDKGVAAFKDGNISAAIKHFSQVVKINPTDAPAHYNLADSYVFIKNYNAAIQHFTTYAQIDPDGADEYMIKDYIDALKEAAFSDKDQAEQILRAYYKKRGEDLSETSISGKKIYFESLMKTANDIIFAKELSENKTVKNFTKAMSAKIPLRFYSVEGLHIDPHDAFGFADAFTLTGYAIAKASIDLLGNSIYFVALPEDIINQFRIGKYEEGIPLSYDMSLMKNGSPIPWKMVQKCLEACIETNLSNFIGRFPEARNIAETIKEYLVREFVYTGYFIGLYENITEGGKTMDNEKIELETLFSMMMKTKEGVCKLKKCPNCGTELKEAKDERYEMKGIGHSNLFAKRCPKCGFKAYKVLEHHGDNST